MNHKLTSTLISVMALAWLSCSAYAQVTSGNEPPTGTNVDCYIVWGSSTTNATSVYRSATDAQQCANYCSTEFSSYCCRARYVGPNGTIVADTWSKCKKKGSLLDGESTDLLP